MHLPRMRVDDKVAIVTGAGSGIGRAIAVALAGAGADVAIAELPGREGTAKTTAAAVQEHGRRALCVPLDVRQVSAITGAVEAVLAEFGRIDILVNNAGISLPRPALEVKEEDWDAVLDTDLKGVFFCSQAVARHFIGRGGGGKIVNIASIQGVGGYFELAAYGAAKGGVVNLTRHLAIEWARHGVNVNAVGPTYVVTPLTETRLADPAYGQEALRRTPLGRFGTPEDIAAAVVYLASPAADLVTGHTLLVDGGWTAW